MPELPNDTSSSSEIAQLVAVQEQFQALKSSHERTKKENEFLRKQKALADERLETYLSISESTPLFEILPDESTNDSLSVPIFLASDWHCEEEVRPETVRGLNEYNLDIAHDRIQRYWSKSVEFALDRKAHTDIPYAIIWLGGDFITGHIHEELTQVTALAPPEAILWVKKRIIAGINYVLQNFPAVHVVCNTGNHGRTTRKPITSGLSQRNSFEWLMYHVIADEFSNNPKITFHIPESYFAEFQVFDFKLRTHHGDNLLYKGGVGGPAIPVNKAIAEWNVADRVDYDYFGHLHQFIDHHSWTINPSLIGYSPFSIDIKGRFQRPMQLVDFIHHKHGRTDLIKLYLD